MENKPSSFSKDKRNPPNYHKCPVHSPKHGMGDMATEACICGTYKDANSPKQRICREYNHMLLRLEGAKRNINNIAWHINMTELAQEIERRINDMIERVKAGRDFKLRQEARRRT